MALGALYGLMGGLGQGLSEGNQELGSAIDRYRKFQDAQRERQALGLIQRSALGGLTGGQPAPGGIDQQQPDYGPGAVQQGPLGPSGPAPGIPSGTAMAPMSIPSRDPEVVKGSWFGSQPGWKDPMSGPQTASGTPLSVPGIALPSRAGLGRQFDVTAPSGQTYRLPQTDVGPAKWTGRGVDINSAAAQQMGYTPQNFPTDKQFRVHPVDQAMGSPPQAAQASSAIARNTMQGMPQTAFGMVQPAQVAQMIERAAGPGVPDDVKGLALMKLFPMFSEQGQEAYKRAWEQHKFQTGLDEKRSEFGQREADRHAQMDIAAGQRSEMAEDRKARLEESTRAHKAAEEERAAGREQRAETAREKGAAAHEKHQGEIDSINFLAAEARDLAKLAREHPEYVGGRGIITRGYGTAKELLTGSAPEGQAEQESFKSRTEALQSRLAKQILGSRYFSGPVQQRMNTLLPALGRFVAPTQAVQSFEEIARQLEQAAGGAAPSPTARPSGAAPAAGGLGGMSDEDILKQLR